MRRRLNEAETNPESTNRNRIRGAADRGERTTDREAPATKLGKRVDPAIDGDRGHRSYPGRSRLTPERATPALRCWACRRSEKSGQRPCRLDEVHDALGPSFVGRRAERRGECDDRGSREGDGGHAGVQATGAPRWRIGVKPRRWEWRSRRWPMETSAQGSEHLLMEEVVGRANLVGSVETRAWQNKGSPGIDGMSVEELPEPCAGTGGRSDSGAGGDLPTEAGHEGKTRSEEWGRGPGVGDSDRAGPVHPTSHPGGLQPRFDPTFSGTATASGLGAEHTSVREAQQGPPGRETMGGGLPSGSAWARTSEKFFDRVNHGRADGAAGKADRG